jgi:type III pantothenate kinase
VTVDLARPDLVGLDRLANVVAVNRLRAANRPALVIGFGSAVTVNLISETGALVGGAILPGVAMSARALHDFTDLLPLVEVAEPPLPLGTSTVGAVSSGLYWGMVGAVRELAARLTAGRSALQVFLTGGAASIFSSALAELADGSPQYVPHLTLGGIAIASCGDGSPKGSR